jgi:hypothetical protein
MRGVIRALWIGVVAVAMGGGGGSCGGSLGGGRMTGAAGTTGGGGVTGVGGTTGVAGTTGGGGTAGDGPMGQPPCPSTVAKGGACADTDVQACVKPCGPESIGLKSEMCTTAGVYVEMSGCFFDPARDYSCYKLPNVANASCPAQPPQANSPCMVDPCLVCNSDGGTTGGGYLDSSGAAKVGFCVCGAATSKWSCASDIAWPCPGNAGC